jgi:hypothetical protein
MIVSNNENSLSNNFHEDTKCDYWSNNRLAKKVCLSEAVAKWLRQYWLNRDNGKVRNPCSPFQLLKQQRGTAF